MKAEWVGAISEAVGAVGTVGTLLIAVIVLGREQADRRERRRDEKAAQARLVSVSIRGDAGTISSLESSGHLFTRAWTIEVANYSAEAITTLAYRWRVAADLAFTARDEHEGVIRVSRVMPGSTDTREGSAVLFAPQGASPDTFVIPLGVELLFTDAAGFRWHRNEQHELTEVLGPDPW